MVCVHVCAVHNPIAEDEGCTVKREARLKEKAGPVLDDKSNLENKKAVHNMPAAVTERSQRLSTSFLTASEPAKYLTHPLQAFGSSSGNPTACRRSTPEVKQSPDEHQNTSLPLGDTRHPCTLGSLHIHTRVPDLHGPCYLAIAHLSAI